LLNQRADDSCLAPLKKRGWDGDWRGGGEREGVGESWGRKRGGQREREKKKCGRWKGKNR